jgi:adhesin transport system membrane fusion protein
MSQLMRYLQGEDDNFEEQEFAAKKSANLLLWLIGGFFVLFLLWAALTNIDRTVRGMGRVVPSAKLQVVSNLEGGVVEQILVRPGQTVRKGDPLVRLSPTSSSAAYGSSAVQVDALDAKIARLNAEVRGVQPQYNSAAGGQVAVERSLHSARMAELQGLMGAAQARVVQAERGVAEAQAQLQARQNMYATAQRELGMLKPLENNQIIAKIDIVKAESAAAVAANEVASAQAALSRARSGVAEARAALAQQRSDWLSRAGMELSQAQAERSAQQQSLPALSDRVDRTVIRAPMSGKVNRVLVTTVGGTVAAGAPVAEIVPSEETLYVEAQVRPVDIANVRLRQRAKVEITAYNSSTFGTMEGLVTSISPDATLNEKSGESFYTVEVQTTSLLKDKDGKRLPIGPGMVANVSLLGEKRSILAYLFTPISKLSETAFRE